MRDLFLIELRDRLGALRAEAARLNGTSRSDEAMDAIRRQLHDIYGTGRPFGVPEATDAAGDLLNLLKTVDVPSVQHVEEIQQMIRNLEGLL